VVLDVLDDQPRAVLAAPGGVVLDPAVRTALLRAFVVWLRADPSALAGRVRRDDHRPLLTDHPGDVLSTMAVDRADLYAHVADLVVDSDRHDATEVSERILAALQTLPSQS
jgi:XRE family aerobic/anaerobic benzoate catabolism transcriptional regulator